MPLDGLFIVESEHKETLKNWPSEKNLFVIHTDV